MLAENEETARAVGRALTSDVPRQRYRFTRRRYEEAIGKKGRQKVRQELPGATHLFDELDKEYKHISDDEAYYPDRKWLMNKPMYAIWKDYVDTHGKQPPIGLLYEFEENRYKMRGMKEANKEGA